MTNPIRVVVADDSPFVCRLLTNYLQSSADFQVVGTALNGLRALQLVNELKPDVVTLDIEMPVMDGIKALGMLMIENPTPVIMVSGISREAAATTLKALDMGAVDFILKYNPDSPVDPEILRQDIIAKVRSASKIKVIRSLKKGRQGQALPIVTATALHDPQKIEFSYPSLKNKEDTPYVTPGISLLPGGIVVVGASTGGPVALRELFSRLPVDFPAAIIVVQHIPPSFTEVLAAQLDRRIALKVREAKNGDPLEPGVVLIAPGDHHLLLGRDGNVIVNQGPMIGGHRPAVDVTMQSVAQLYGSRTTGIILTGMGNDGSQGMVAIRSKKGRTYAQSGDTCVVNGMPQRAVEKGVVDRIGSPSDIGRFIVQDCVNSMTLSRMKYVQAS
ncbi:MAG: chemotaxis response regulator protein-glutamate methylesterase [Desulfobulbaceae bacterium]|nr:chemotaxis response regulator protein-glutamate methylesterase [Desulfobulbaceae bacterium]